MRHKAVQTAHNKSRDVYLEWVRNFQPSTLKKSIMATSKPTSSCKAHIGVGISGQEGRQAVMASDFALPRFKQLRRNLLSRLQICGSHSTRSNELELNDRESLTRAHRFFNFK